jgi:hypothetical protein
MFWYQFALRLVIAFLLGALVGVDVSGASGKQDYEPTAWWLLVQRCS